MEKVLTQEEIDAMVRAASGGESAKKAGDRNVIRWDARLAGHIGGEQLRILNAIHEGFARNLTHSLGAYLRIAFSAALVSAEHLAYGEFLSRLPEINYLVSCRLNPLAATALLQLDLGVAFPLIDVLLGGEGNGSAPVRQNTEIEEQILEILMRIICRELQTAWQALSMEFEFEKRVQPDQVQHLMPADEKVLSLSFEISAAEARGTLTFLLPEAVSAALIRKISANRAPSKPRFSLAGSGENLRTRLRLCPFSAELMIPDLAVRASDLMELPAGALLVFRRQRDQPGALFVAGHEMFIAAMARHGSVRVAQLLASSPASAGAKGDNHE